MSEYSTTGSKSAALRRDETAGAVSNSAVQPVVQDTESTSATLCRVEQERDELAARLETAERESERREETVARNVFERDRWHGVADMLQQQRDLARAELVSARTELDAVRTARDNLERELAEARGVELIEITRDLTDPDPCQYDHHGYCKAHGWTDIDPRCPHARAKEVLEATDERP